MFVYMSRYFYPMKCIMRVGEMGITQDEDYSCLFPGNGIGCEI